MGDGGGDHFHNEGLSSTHVMALQHLGGITNQRCDTWVFLGPGLERDEGPNRQADFFRLYLSVVTRDNTHLFHLTHAFGHRWRCQRNLATQLAKRESCVLLEGTKDLQPGAIKELFKSRIHIDFTYKFKVTTPNYLLFCIGKPRLIWYDSYMDVAFLLKGLALGFSIAAPIGPIGILCVRRTLTEGRAFGLVSGLGAATADAVYGMVAGFGITFISSLLIGQRVWLNLAGGIFLCYLGVRTFLAQPAERAAATRQAGLLGAYASTLFLTLTNPMTIMFFAAVFAGLGITTAPSGYLSSGLLVTGVFLGSALWWFVLTSGASLFLAKSSTHHWCWINRISGVILVGFGVAALLSLILQ